MQVPAGVPVKVPDPVLPKVTVPDGVAEVLPETLVTVTVQVVATPTFTGLGEHVTEVDVVSIGLVTERKEKPELVA